MHDPTNGHGPPLTTMLFGFVAFVAADEAGRLIALAIGCTGAVISIVRFVWDWEDRRERKATRRSRPEPDRPSA